MRCYHKDFSGLAALGKRVRARGNNVNGQKGLRRQEHILWREKEVQWT